MVLRKVLLTKNNCYKKGGQMKPKGILVHSTGANNPNLRRYVGPNDGYLGKPSSENWNQPTPGGRQVCVHAFIGKLADGTIATYQTLPFDMPCWGCGKGSKGSYNNSHIQFEICEDALNDKAYFDAVYKEATEFCAYLCEEYDLDVSTITTHCDAHRAGYASNHADVMHWFPKFGKNMDTFRSDVKKLLNKSETTSKPQKDNSDKDIEIGLYKIICDELNIRKGPGTNYGVVGVVKQNQVYTIVEIQNGTWGRLVSGAGWINCHSKYCKRQGDIKQTQPQQKEDKSYLVRVTADDGLNIRKGPGVNYAKVGCITDKGTYTIVETNGNWGKLKSGVGWICLDYTKRV